MQQTGDRLSEKLWKDAVTADDREKVISGAFPGDRAKAIDESHALFKEHANFEKLREIFMRDLKV
jgi:hypothetical protein